jgi:adenylate cyclase
VRQPGSPREQLLNGARLVHIPDCSISELPIARASAELEGVGTTLFAPLRRSDGALLGHITAYRQEVRPFSDNQIALLENFAAQVVIAMENARLMTETREALEQQTATAEVLQVINSSPGDLALVFEAMLKKATRLCEASFGIMRTYDGQHLEAVARHGVPASFVEWLERNERNPSVFGPGTAPARIVSGEDLIHTVDLMATELYQSGDPTRRAFVDLGGARTLLIAALRQDGALLGTIGVYRQEVRAFTDRQIALLENFAAQAVIAMENARLLTETREALEQQTATAEVLQVINSSPGDLTPVFEAMLEKAMRLGGAAFGSIYTYDGERFHSAAHRGLPPAFAAYRAKNPPLRSVPGSGAAVLLETRRPLHVLDLRVYEPNGHDNRNARAMIELGGVRTILAILAVPLIKDDAFLGMITIYRQEVQAFSNKQIALLENFAAQAVIAMENARLLGELRERTDQVAELNRGLEARVADQVEELSRVGRLKRFLAPQLAELIVSQGNEKILESHRREIVVVFCDLRGYTAFAETAEPEEVLEFLREYHGALGPLVSQFEGTLDQFSGDGIMVFFNDPVPIPDPAERAVRMAMAMREAAGALIADWRERGRDLGFGAGIAQGYATLGQIGFSERSGYTAIGTVCNVAARLCAEAKDGQILLGQRVNVALKGSVATEQVGAVALKGLTQPVVAYNVPLATPPTLRVIEGGPLSV